MVAVAAAAVLVWYVIQGGFENGGDAVRVAFFPNVGHAVPVIAAEQNMFVQYMGDVPVHILLFDSGPQAVEALFSGSIDMAYVGPGPAISGYLKAVNDPVRILAGAASGGSSLIVHPDSGISTPTDMAGAKVAAPQIGNSQDISLRTYLAEHNLETAERGGDVVIYNIANPDIHTLFVKGEVDAAWVPEPWGTILVQEHGGIRLFHEEDLWEDGAFASTLLIARDGFVANRPDVVYDWLAMHNASIQWINNNPTGAQESIMQYMEDTLGRSFPEHILAEAMENIQFTADPLPHTVDAFAQRADILGYLGRDGYVMTGLYYDIDGGTVQIP